MHQHDTFPRKSVRSAVEGDLCSKISRVSAQQYKLRIHRWWSMAAFRSNLDFAYKTGEQGSLLDTTNTDKTGRWCADDVCAGQWGRVR